MVGVAGGYIFGGVRDGDLRCERRRRCLSVLGVVCRQPQTYTWRMSAFSMRGREVDMKENWVMVGWLECTGGMIDDKPRGEGICHMNPLLDIVKSALCGGQWDCFNDRWASPAGTKGAPRFSFFLLDHSSCFGARHV